MPSRRKILVVDDAPLGRALVRAMLPADFVVEEAGGVPEALERYRGFRPDVVLCDMTMPGQDGFDLLREVKAVDPEAKVIICSGDIQNSGRQKAFSLGAKAFVLRPIIPRTLLAEIEKLLPQDRPPAPRQPIFTSQQWSAIVEIIQIGVGKTAANLSHMLKRRVEMVIPELDIQVLTEFMRLYSHIDDEAYAVSMHFQGEFSGDAILFFPRDSGQAVIETFQRSIGGPENADFKLSILAEVGNILVNAFVGSFGNILDTGVTFTPPTVADHAPGLIEKLCAHEGLGAHYGFIIKTEFFVKQSQVHCYLMLIVGPQSHDFIHRAIERML